MKARHAAGGLLLLYFAAAGCGGNVAIDGDSAEGGGGDAGSASGGGSGGNAGSGGDAGGGGGGSDDPCPAYCEAFYSDGCGPTTQDECVENCENWLVNVGKCRDTLADILECTVETPPVQPECAWVPCSSAQGKSLAGCVFHSAKYTGKCEPEGTDWSCTVVTDAATFGMLCQPSGSKTCACSVNGELVGTCQAASIFTLVEYSCCAKFFAEIE